MAALASAMHASKSMSIQPWPTEEKCNCVFVPSQLRLCSIEIKLAEWETGCVLREENYTNNSLDDTPSFVKTVVLKKVN